MSIRNTCERANVVPEPCEACDGCQAMRDGIIPPLVEALRAEGRNVDDAYMRYLYTMPIPRLAGMFDYWTMPKYVY